MDDLLDQIGKSKFFSTLDLASGYWQIKMHPDRREKTAFVTHQGLYEFNVMPFGLMNAPAIFQRTMQQVLSGLNPGHGQDFVLVYIDDVLIFSPTLEDHLAHIHQAVRKIADCGLNLKPSKCQFVRHEVEFLGHVITPDGLRPDASKIGAVRQFPTPKSVKELHQFLGLASYYWRFVPCFARLASPLHALTQKSALFHWTDECQIAFNRLKAKLTEAPVLAYPDFDKPFVLETDASNLGLGAVLSQHQVDGKQHPVAYASRALTQAEKRYSITELETLAVVWAVSYFRFYLYGHDVSVYTDHSAVKAVLGNPNASGKHAHWWSKVFGSGIRRVDIIYRPGKENVNADVLSLQPHLAAPSHGVAESEVEVSLVADISNLLDSGSGLTGSVSGTSFAEEQRKDQTLLPLIDYLLDGTLPKDEQEACKVLAKASYCVISSIGLTLRIRLLRRLLFLVTLGLKFFIRIMHMMGRWPVTFLVLGYSKLYHATGWNI